MTDKNENKKSDDDAEMRCDSCAFSELQTPTGVTVTIGQRIRICRANPPTPVMVPEQMKDASGNVFVQVNPRSVFPIVQDDWFCFQFEEREGAEMEPTGLTVPSAND